MKVDAISTPVNVIAAGKTNVPINSIKTTNCIEQQNVPHKSFTRTSSNKLWTVELIQRRRCDKRTRNSFGTIVLQMAWGTKINLRRGNVLSIKVVKYRSSPSNNKFLLCKVSVTFSLYASTISGFATIGTQLFLPPFGAFIRYVQKHPGKHVTPPKILSKALLK